MIDICLSDGRSLSDFFPFAFGGILSMTGIIASILLFLAQKRISQATNMLDNLNIKIANDDFKEKKSDCDLKYIEIKKWLDIYTHQWNNARLEIFFRCLFYLFFISAFMIVLSFLGMLCKNTLSSNENIVFFILSFPLFVFLFIIYEILEAPQSLIFRQWRPHIIIRNKPYQNIAERHINFVDLLRIEKCEYDPFRSIRIKKDNIYIYLYNFYLEIYEICLTSHLSFWFE